LERVQDVPRLYELYPGICLTTEERARKNLSQGRKTSVRLENLSQGRKASVRVEKPQSGYKNLSQGTKTSVRVEKLQSG